MSTLAAAPEGAAPGDPPSPTAAVPPGWGRVSPDAVIGLCLTAALLAIAFVTSGGVDQTAATAGNTWTEILLTLLGGGALVMVILIGGPGRAWGAGTVALMGALAALTALSIIWSVVPDTSWAAADQMLSYLAVFAAAVTFSRLAPSRWPALLGAIAVVTAALSGWALLAKVFPSALGGASPTGRLQAPFGYWNAVGLTAALGLPACLWAGARRDRGRLLAGLAAPAITLLLSAAVLSYSRSSNAAAVIAIAGWMVFVPLRLRSAAILAVGGAGAAAVSAYALSTSAFTSDTATSTAAAGRTFGIVLLAVIVIAAACGWATARAMNHRTIAPTVRRRIGTVLVVGTCLIPVAAIGALATSSRGLTGQISHAWSQLTSTSTVVYNNPGRVFQFGSSRPGYWHEGIEVGQHALLKGVGASGFGTARLRYTTDGYKVDQAHSYVFETFADLGLIGIAITLALLVAWMLAAARPVALGTRWGSLERTARDERDGMVALGLIVVGFGIQSTLDWTWYFPGVAVPVLLCAGWLAGRGPLAQRVGLRETRRSLLDRPGAVAIAAAGAALTVAGAWMQWQPLRSDESYQASISAVTNAQAFADARAAVDDDPLGYQPRFLLAALYLSNKDVPAARAQLVKATQVQPQNPLTWFHLGQLELAVGEPQSAIVAMERVLALDHTPDQTAHAATASIQEARLHFQLAKAAAAPKPKH